MDGWIGLINFKNVKGITKRAIILLSYLFNAIIRRNCTIN